ncbi:ABC transporter permease, partial [Streptomyces sp. NPDC059744]|uniref:ABC transporter permease n=1 Tax=Streptomyces sp. NPDC059744 TaxID=3346929 RepID=UPI003654320B
MSAVGTGTTGTSAVGATTIGWAVADSWTMTRRELAHWARQPVQIVVGLVFPVMLLLMFNYLVGGGQGVDGDNTEFLVPGMLALTMAFGLESTMLAVTQDLTKGVIDRFRSMPMVSGSVLVGRSVADMLQSVAALAVMIGVGYAVGWRWHDGVAAALGAVGLLLLLRFAMLWIGIQLAMVAGKPEMVQAVQILVWPVGFLSRVLATHERCGG